MEYENEVRVCIAVQKLGKATNEEILTKLKEDNIRITLKQIEKATTNLQKRGILSLNYDTSKGYSQKAYSMSKSIFSRDVPIAHYKDIVDTSNPEIKKLIKELQEKKGTGKGRMPDYRNYYIVEVEFKVQDKILGFMPFKTENYLEFYRDDGKIIFLPSHFRAWIGVNLRLENKTERTKNYIGYNYGVASKEKTKRISLSIIDGGQGKGMRDYETLEKGTIIKTKFRVPETLFTKEKFKKFLETIGEFPIRCFGGRATAGYGHLKLTNFNVI